MFDIGLLEIAVIVVVALFAVGPDRLPEIARALGRARRVMKRWQREWSNIWSDIETYEPEQKSTPTDKKPQEHTPNDNA